MERLVDGGEFEESVKRRVQRGQEAREEGKSKSFGR